MTSWIKRKKTKVVNVGGVLVGGDNPISIQSMTNTNTCDVVSTVNQIMREEKLLLGAMEKAVAREGTNVPIGLGIEATRRRWPDRSG